MNHKFIDREDAGRKLAKALNSYKGKKDALILALPRGGVPVAFEVAEELGLSLDVLVVRKLGVPGHDELAMGAIAYNGIRFINRDIVGQLHISDSVVERITKREKKELDRRSRLYRDNLPFPDISNKTVILIDDGVATGATMKAAISAVREAKAKHIVVAIPVGSASTCGELMKMADEVICLEVPDHFYAVGQWYNNFSQTTDSDVQQFLFASRRDWSNNNKVRRV